MATFSNISESGVAESLSATIGKSAGSLGSKAISKLSVIQDKMGDLCKRISEGDSKASKELKNLEKELNTIEKTINSVEKSLKPLQKTVTTLKKAAKVAKKAVKVAKIAAMIPKMPPILAIVLDTASELIAQILQVVSAIEAVIKIIRSILDAIRKMLDRLRKLINSLFLGQSIQDLVNTSSDNGLTKKRLQDKGILDSSGEDIFTKLAPSFLSTQDSVILLSNGNAGDEEGNSEDGNASGNGNNGDNKGAASSGQGQQTVDLTDTATLNKIKSNKGAASVEIVSGNTGDWILDLYCQSDTEPTLPVRELNPEGWNKLPTGEDNIWKISTTVSGKTNKPSAWQGPFLLDLQTVASILNKDGVGVDSNLLNFTSGKDKLKEGSINLENTVTMNRILVNLDNLKSNVRQGNSNASSSNINSILEDLSKLKKVLAKADDSVTLSSISNNLNSLKNNVRQGNSNASSVSLVDSISIEIVRFKDSLGLKDNGNTLTVNLCNILDATKSGADLSSRTNSLSPTVAFVSDSDEAFGAMLNVLDILDKAGISLDAMDNLRNSVSNSLYAEDGTDENAAVDPYYTDSAGNIYEIVVRIDNITQKIAPLRYTETYNEDGVLVYQGSKTFAVTESVIIEETKLKLAEILG